MLPLLCIPVVREHLLAEIEDRQWARNTSRGTNGDNGQVPSRQVSLFPIYRKRTEIIHTIP
jgi:hypothetical protein